MTEETSSQPFLSQELLDLLRDPEAGHPLTPDDSHTKLTSSTTGKTYPIIKGIPRFVDQEHLSSFGLQWNKYEVAHDDEDRATFSAKTGMELSELKGLKILDAGCGGGRYCKVAAEAGGIVFGADHTTAVEKAQKLCAHLDQVHLVQADLKHLPFEPESFDFVFSIGVMHHDKDTRAVFDAVARMVKPGGRYSVWLYRKNQWWQEWINTGLRKITTRMSPEKLEPWCRLGAWLGGIPVINKTLNKVINFSNHPNWENRVCDTFDWFAPAYQYHHTVGELCSWFEQAGFENLKVLPPEKTGGVYRWCYDHNLLIGSGVNVQGTKFSTVQSS
ncbi:Ubiquinone biosynthesis O-methyltransferase [Gimesia panareensis]|uniref:Ubiquinone biosynthesis O-methyltransferase n=1 Tax=Gimesia panareensis TaxID=2527978 RepID=A0A517Q6I6_9PLAN|nr:methyltransferase domain-containing protein [Gimesia panareensis]QDT27251.1 Ubiquinone biosynthesis O-methyltransferase [Gimesia panareensis]